MSAGTSIFSAINTQLSTLNEHFHMPAKVYPTLAAGVVVTGAAGAWALGAFAVIVPANAIAAPFDIHSLNCAAASANDIYELVLYSGPDGSEVEIGRVRMSRLSSVGFVPHDPFMTPIQGANSQIKAKVASQAGGSHTITISVSYHTY